MTNYKHLHYFWMVAKSGGLLRASEQLHASQQTLSGQIKLLEERLGKPLFQKRGRKLELTEAGKTVFSYADEIFSLGAEMEQALRTENQPGRAIEFRVGVADALPKAIAYRLLEPAMRLPSPVRIVCREWKLDSLMAELATHRLDLVIADSPIPSGLSVKAYNHKLGRSGQSFFAAPSLAERCLGAFPTMLTGMPMLMHSEDSDVQKQLNRWLEHEHIYPEVVGVFDDSALLKAFGREGQGVFAAPTVLEAEIVKQFDVRVLGRTAAVWQEFYAISIERRITHPCVLAICNAARGALFASP
ncbi:transcriptional activator NhaR [Uliginosibacterium sp. 31-16]|uniref:transcriptional activator NhaR n=1 Tax=Uliginosibacterium sp. 31-16 TaxID=3068315 RepID=UPI00273FC485|nr:transcriptional activator NhaR [Uliginosibacterium sp. 31-16]MDP5237930.1 transcriptional activator NhaR [Uliginosibacterium sp. 31-16]